MEEQQNPQQYPNQTPPPQNNYGNPQQQYQQPQNGYGYPQQQYQQPQNNYGYPQQQYQQPYQPYAPQMQNGYAYQPPQKKEPGRVANFFLSLLPLVGFLPCRYWFPLWWLSSWYL